MRTMGILKFVPIGVLMAVAIGASICGCGSAYAVMKRISSLATGGNHEFVGETNRL